MGNKERPTNYSKRSVNYYFTPMSFVDMLLADFDTDQYGTDYAGAVDENDDHNDNHSLGTR